MKLYFIIILEFSSFIFICGADYVNNYGEAYGRKWIYIPDGEGIPQFVNLTLVHEPQILRSATNDYSTDIEYRLYTPENPKEYKILSNRNPACGNDCFKPNIPLKIVTHGWMSTADQSSVMLIKNAYMKINNSNVIAVDWSAISMSYIYPMVALETSRVGEAVGTFIDYLADKYGITGEQIHLIGHSLGAHVMGNAASTTKLKIRRITGLDPARPMFEFPVRDPSVRLDPSDAEFVDVIHTCAGVLGYESRVGDADFYPNNGMPPQPGCYGIQAIAEACSHSRAHIYFSETITSPQSFPARKCHSWIAHKSGNCSNETIYMGEHVDQQLRGTFYLITNSQAPFGRSFPNDFPS